jgi:hypothetical protein
MDIRQHRVRGENRLDLIGRPDSESRVGLDTRAYPIDTNRYADRAIRLKTSFELFCLQSFQRMAGHIGCPVAARLDHGPWTAEGQVYCH